MKSKKKANNYLALKTKKNIGKTLLKTKKRVKKLTQQAGGAAEQMNQNNEWSESELSPIERASREEEEQHEASIKGVKLSTTKALKKSLSRDKRALYSSAQKIGNRYTKFKKQLQGEEYEQCTLSKQLEENESDGFGSLRGESLKNKVVRQSKTSDFFKKEDEYFKSLIGKHLNRFCFENKEASIETEYSRFCKNITKYCLKTPNLLHELLFDAIDTKATTRMWNQMPSTSQRAIEKRMMKNYPKVYSEKPKADNEEKGTRAVTVMLFQEENMRNLAKFFIQVIIKSIIEYKESAEKAPKSTYTSNIIMEPYVDDMLKNLFKGGLEKKSDGAEAGSEGNADQSDGEDAENAEPGLEGNEGQSGGASGVTQKQIKDKLAKEGSDSGNMYSIAELKKISEHDFFDALKNCKTKDLLKKDYDTKLDGGLEGGDEYKETDDSIESLGEAGESPKLMYIVMGSLLLVGIIELGVFDAPPCLSHTIL